MPHRALNRNKDLRVASLQTAKGASHILHSPRKNGHKLQSLPQDAPCFFAKLPDEMILEIFHFCLAILDVHLDFAEANVASTMHHDHTDLGSTPLNISQVSVRWRRIALSSKTLWSVVVLRVDLLQQRHFAALDLWLSRSLSKSTPLTISLAFYDETQSHAIALSYFRRIMTHSKRLKILHVQLHHDLPDEFDVELLNGPVLEEFAFTTACSIAIPLKMARSPRLRKLRIHGRLGFSVRSLEGLRTLDLNLRDKPEDFLSLLGRFPSLESLIVKFTYWLLPEPSPTSLPKLRSLSLYSGRTAESSFHFADRILEIAPSLSDLELKSPWPYSPLRWRQLTSSVEKHKPPLMRLSMWIDAENDDQPEIDAPQGGFLAALLRNMPNLRTLSTNYGTCENFVRAMTLQSATDLNICPELEEVHFGRFSGAVTAHCLVNMIVSRINTGEKALKRVKLTPFHYHDISRRKVIKMSMSRGLQLSSMVSK